MASVYRLLSLSFLVLFATAHPSSLSRHDVHKRSSSSGRERININKDWKFHRFNVSPDELSYEEVLKPWILPSANDFIANGTQFERPDGQAPGYDVEYTQASFDDSSWEDVRLPHDWAIQGPFNAPGVSGDMGRLPVNGVGWYRHTLTFSEDDTGRTLFLDIDGAMSYSAVWLNGELVGGWPFGYSSYRLDLTPYVKIGEDNQLAIRLDNPLDSSRWYPGAGLYRSVWLVKTNSVHVEQWGTRITTPSVSAEEATIDVVVNVKNEGDSDAEVFVETEIKSSEDASVAKLEKTSLTVEAGDIGSVTGSVSLESPSLWGPLPDQTPNLYVAVTTLSSGNGTVIDQYETPFGIREITYDPDRGVIVNGQEVYIHGVNNHHDLGSLGAAFNVRAAERQLEVLQELGCNSLRVSHNPPAGELLDLADRMGFLVMDEAFDVWNYGKHPENDFHLIFADWGEADMRALVRRDFNHPSIIAWSLGNEIPEQRTEEGAVTGKRLYDIVVDEDPTRPITASLNSAKPGEGFADLLDIKSLNYQGEGRGSNWTGSYPDFRRAYPDNVLLTTESAATISTRGTYIFPVVANNSGIIGDGSGGNSTTMQASAYELYAAEWASSPDIVFQAQDKYSYIAGEFVWSGWDYLGEPTPYSDARSSYFGIIDLAGFKKDRYYLYQSRWRPELKFAHILPHWSWGDDRVGEVTPVHVFSSADEAELFVNGKSVGRQVKKPLTYRFRWDNVTYSPGDVRVVTYKEGSLWAEASRKTVGGAAALSLSADRDTITADGYDLSFITVAVLDEDGEIVPDATDSITFSISGPGEIVSTDNGNPADFTSFPSLTREACSGLALAVVRTMEGETGAITVTASAEGLEGAEVVVTAI